MRQFTVRRLSRASAFRVCSSIALISLVLSSALHLFAQSELFIQDQSRQAAVWTLGGAGGNDIQGFTWVYNGNAATGWTFRASVDLDGNGTPDIIWQNDSTGQVAVWYMTDALGTVFGHFDWIDSTVGDLANWKVVGFADLNHDGHPDMILQQTSTRQVAVWYMGGPTGNTFQSFGWIASWNVPGWTAVGVADMNGDGQPDILLQYDSNRSVAVWYMGGPRGNDIQSDKATFFL